jgi:TonB-dependent receptor
MEHVRQKSSGYIRTGGSSSDPNSYTLNTFDHDYTNFFPSLHFNYRLAADQVVRLAFNSGINRASFSVLRPNATISDENETVSGGNPTIEPTTSMGVDLYYEWYFSRRGILSAGVFYKNIEDPMFGTTTVVESEAFNTGGVDRRGYRYSTTSNGSDGKIYGYELGLDLPFEGLLPEPFDGLGIRANYTYNRDNAKTPSTPFATARNSGLSGSSRITYNVALYYERYNLSTTLSYQYRSPWLNSVDLGQADGELDLYWDARPQMDFSLNYAISENVSIFMEVNNITEEYGRRIYNRRSRVYEVEGFGRTFLGGLKLNF